MTESLSSSSHSVENPISDHLARKAAESPSLGMIINCQAQFVPLEDNQYVPKDKYDFPGYSSTYEVTFPGYRQDGSDWRTWMTHWQPRTAYEGYRRAPAETLTILTGEGDMTYSDDPEVVSAVAAEARRQEDELRRQP
ncbi:MAG TPA: hypothetical protein VK978_00600 [Candidatus Saccharimonadales bacterium]|nr:hypothetical protein [Candidatus Saccharimonadales bacterium]